MDDKDLERQRYDARAKSAMQVLSVDGNLRHGSSSVPLVLRAPYVSYEAYLQRELKPNSMVLEIGSGTGEFTEVLLNSGAQVTATDISASSLKLLRLKYSARFELTTKTCDMEALPFLDNTFDLVASAGSLSYGDNSLVLEQIHRILKPGGCFVCVDSLNHHPFYRLNRYIHYLRGDRSQSTLRRMPTCDLIRLYQETFGGSSAVHYFGSLSWAFGPLSRLSRNAWWAMLSDRLDHLLGVRKSAFKFVLIVRKGG